LFDQSFEEPTTDRYGKTVCFHKRPVAVILEDKQLFIDISDITIG
jgi:hypothetical protein